MLPRSQERCGFPLTSVLARGRSRACHSKSEILLSSSLSLSFQHSGRAHAAVKLVKRQSPQFCWIYQHSTATDGHTLSVSSGTILILGRSRCKIVTKLIHDTLLLCCLLFWLACQIFYALCLALFLLFCHCYITFFVLLISHQSELNLAWFMLCSSHTLVIPSFKYCIFSYVHCRKITFNNGVEKKKNLKL